ncbi:MAG: VOC family protein [Marivirga sp.]|nr:VOC family protein [Marivirga sp.]
MKAHSQETQRVAFIPTLYLKDLSAAIAFYKKAFGATERWQIEHPKGTVHVAEMSVSSVLFRMHDEVSRDQVLSPATMKGTSIIMGLLTDDPDTLFERALSAGATEISPMQDFDYGYRQGTLRDPFGHHWCLERLDDFNKVPMMAAQSKSE